MTVRERLVKWLGGATQAELEEIRKRSMVAELEALETAAEEDEDEKTVYETLAQAYRKKGWIFASVWRVATTAASVPIDVYRNGQKVGSDDPARTLLEKPNPYESGWLLRMKTVADLLIEGRAFWVMEPLPLPNVRPDAIPPQKLRRLPPKNVRVEGSEKEFVTHFCYEVNGKETKITPRRVVWFSTYDPLDERGGVGALEAARSALLLDEYAYESNIRFFRNDGTPGNVLEPSENAPVLTMAELKRYEEHWKRAFAGVKNRSRTAVLPPGYKHKAVNPPIKDMLFAEMRKWNRMEMAAPFGVPPTLLGDFERATHSNMAAALGYFYLFTIDPILKLLCSAINAFYLPMFGPGYEASFDLAPFLPEGMKTQAEADAILVKAGIITPNEARAKRKLPPVPGGDTLQLGSHDVGIAVQPGSTKELHEIEVTAGPRPVRAGENL